MKGHIIILSLILAPLTASQLVYPALLRRPITQSRLPVVINQHQHPIMADRPNIALPPSNNNEDPPPSSDTDNVIISDVIGMSRSINIFAGFTRDIDTIASRLEDQSTNTTVLCPLNSAIQKLPRKPWEDPREYAAMGDKAYQGEDGEDRAHRNLRRFVEAHVVLGSPWKAGEKKETVGGGKVWWEEKDGKKWVGL